MKYGLSFRIKIYAVLIGVYVAFGLIEGWYDIFPWGAIVITVVISAIEIGTYYSVKKRLKP